MVLHCSLFCKLPGLEVNIQNGVPYHRDCCAGSYKGSSVCEKDKPLSPPHVHIENEQSQYHKPHEPPQVVKFKTS